MSALTNARALVLRVVGEPGPRVGERASSGTRRRDVGGDESASVEGRAFAPTPAGKRRRRMSSGPIVVVLARQSRAGIVADHAHRVPGNLGARFPQPVVRLPGRRISSLAVAERDRETGLLTLEETFDARS